MKLSLSKIAFSKLFKMILVQCEEENSGFDKTASKGPRLFGFGKYTNTSHVSIKKVLCENKDVKYFLKRHVEINDITLPSKEYSKLINGKYLYNIHRELSDNKIYVSISQFYRDLYLTFLGYDTLKKFISANLSEEEQKIQEALYALKDGQPSTLAVKYKGYYYSFTVNNIKSFDFEIDFIGDLTTKEVGLHDQIEGSNAQKEFFGKGTIKGNNAYFNLESKDGTELKIILYRGTDELRNIKIIKGNYSTVSTHGFPISGEAMFLQEADHKENIVLAIKQYLFLQRKNFRVSPNIYYNRELLKAKKHSIKTLYSMIGHYRIWSKALGANKKISKTYFQSRFIVNEDFSSTLETVYNNTADKIQPCWLWVTEGKNGKNLSVTSYQNRGVNIRNHAIIQIPKNFRNNYALGVSAGIGVKRRGLIASNILLEKITEKESQSLNVGMISNEMIQEDEKLRMTQKRFEKHFGKTVD